MENVKCPICKYRKILNQKDNIIDCIRCGKYEIDDIWRGIDDIDVKVLNKIEKNSAKISGYIRLQNENKIIPIITNESIDKILMDSTLPKDNNDIERKAKYLLERLKARTKHFGDFVKLKKEEDCSLGFAHDFNELRALFKYLADLNYLEIQTEDTYYISIILKEKGLKGFVDRENEKPLVFISYASEELKLADFIKKILGRCSEDKIDIFIAKRDIAPGEDPLKVMMEKKLKNANAIVPICTEKSRNSGWLWWESATVWAKGRGVYPLFVNISPNDFGAPLILVTQGKDYFDKKELFETINSICEELKVENKVKDFIETESKEYKKLKDGEYFDNSESEEEIEQLHLTPQHEPLDPETGY